MPKTKSKKKTSRPKTNKRSRSKRGRGKPSTGAVLQFLEQNFPGCCFEAEDTDGLCDLLWELAQELERSDDPRLLKVAEHLDRLEGGLVDLHLLFAVGYAANRCYVLAQHRLEQFLKLAPPDHPQISNARTQLGSLAKITTGFGVATEYDHRRAAAHEEMQLLLGDGRYREAEKLALKTLRAFPDDPPSLNNLSLAEFQLGKTEKAAQTAQVVLDDDPANIHALANLVRISLHLGRREQAEHLANTLKKTKKSGCNPWYKTTEALAFLGDDRGILETLCQVEADDFTPFLLHLYAVAWARVGDWEEACALWRQCLEIEPDYSLAHANLENFHQPDEERAPAWPYPMTHWLTDTEFKAMRKAIARSKEPLDRVPTIRHILPLALERGCPDTVNLFLQLVSNRIDDEIGEILINFAQGKIGSFRARLKAAQLCREAGVIPAGRVKLWRASAWTELDLLGFSVVRDRDVKPHPRKIAQIGELGLLAFEQGRLDEAETHFLKVLELLPTAPDMLNNLTAIAQLKGQEERAIELLEKNYRLNPTYLRASLGLAQVRLNQERLDEAQELLAPALKSTQLDYGEFGMLCDVQIRLLMAQKSFEAAAKWEELWDSMEDQEPECARFRPASMRNPLWANLKDAMNHLKTLAG